MNNAKPKSSWLCVTENLLAFKTTKSKDVGIRHGWVQGLPRTFISIGIILWLPVQLVKGVSLFQLKEQKSQVFMSTPTEGKEGGGTCPLTRPSSRLPSNHMGVL